MALPPNAVSLSAYGKMMDEAIQNIPQHYPSVRVDKYVIMPNHVHLILIITESGSALRSPTIATVINQTKGYVTKHIGIPLFQRSFHDHSIRNERDYIDQNPIQWESDCFDIP